MYQLLFIIAGCSLTGTVRSRSIFSWCISLCACSHSSGHSRTSAASRENHWTGLYTGGQDCQLWVHCQWSIRPPCCLYSVARECIYLFLVRDKPSSFFIEPNGVSGSCGDLSVMSVEVSGNEYTSRLTLTATTELNGMTINCTLSSVVDFGSDTVKTGGEYFHFFKY